MMDCDGHTGNAAANVTCSSGGSAHGSQRRPLRLRGRGCEPSRAGLTSCRVGVIRAPFASRRCRCVHIFCPSRSAGALAGPRVRVATRPALAVERRSARLPRAVATVAEKRTVAPTGGCATVPVHRTSRRRLARSGALQIRPLPADVTYDAIIVGSGMGGLATAAQMVSQGAKVLVLEKASQRALQQSA